MHLGRPHGISGPGALSSAVPGWRPAYHRDIADSNIYLHYERAGRSQITKAKYNAFPQIVLGDFGESAVQGDDPAEIQPGVFPASTIHPNLEEWTDVYQFGCVIRRLCMAHILEDTKEDDDEDEDDDGENEDDDEENEDDDEEGEDDGEDTVGCGIEEDEDQILEETEIGVEENDEEMGEDGDDSEDNDSEESEFDTWALHRPESHTLQFCNTFFGGQIYSDDLINLLQAFERPDMGTTAVTSEPHLVPTMAWVAGTLLPAARQQMQRHRDPPVPSIAHFQDLDVSWTKPETLRPFAVVPGSAESVNALGRLREDLYGSGQFDRPRPQIQRLEMAPPVLSSRGGGRNDVPASMWEGL